MMAGMSLVTLTTMTLDLTEAFERLLSPFARIGVPAHEIGMIMGIALRFMPQFATEFSSIREAQLARGAGLKTSPLRGVQMLSSLMTPCSPAFFAMQRRFLRQWRRAATTARRGEQGSIR